MAEVTEIVTLSVGDEDSVSLPDSISLTTAEFEASGDDLIVTGADGSQVVIEDYYAGDTPPELTTPDGAQVSGEMVVQLTGSMESESAEALPGDTSDGDTVIMGSDGADVPEGNLADNPIVITGSDGEPIGNVENLSGEVFAIRTDGSRVELQMGDPVFQGDILESGPDAGVGIMLADETTFSMGEDGRMVLDEMVYDPATQEGSVSMSVLQGVFTFVSGQVAKTDPDAMTLDTPVATIGIRGTQVGISLPNGENMEIVLMEEADGFVGEVVVQNDAGVQVLNTASDSTTVRGFDIAPAAIRSMELDEIVSGFGGALANLPMIHGNQNSFGTQPEPGEVEGEGEAVPELEDAELDAEDLADFETAAGEEVPEVAPEEAPEIAPEIIIAPLVDLIGDTPKIVPELEPVEQQEAPRPQRAERNEVFETVVEDLGPKTISGEGTITGSNDGEIIIGSEEDDVIDALGGADTVFGEGGDDTIDGGAGADIIDGGTGADVIDGGTGADRIDGGEGADIIDGGEGGDLIAGGEGADTIDGGTGADIIDGGTGDDIIAGGEGGDLIVGGTGDDKIEGGAGNDIIAGDEGDDTIDGGVGDDVIGGGVGDDTITGGIGADILAGGAGKDTLDGGLGDDVLFLNEGGGAIIGGSGDDVLVVDGEDVDADVVINMLENEVTITRTAEPTEEGAEPVVYTEVTSLDGIENVIAGAGDDTITGSVYDNIIFGGAGNDVIDGAAGRDTAVYSDNFGDVTLSFNPEDGTITVSGPEGTDTLSNIENLEFADLTLAAIEAPILEDQSYDLDLYGALDGLGEAISVTIQGVPEGAELSAGTNNGDGSWTITSFTTVTTEPTIELIDGVETEVETEVETVTSLSDLLEGLTLTPPENSNTDFTLLITGEAADGSSTDASMVNMIIEGVADTANLETGDVSGPEDTWISLAPVYDDAGNLVSGIDTSLVDTDGSEVLSLVIAGVPQGPGFNDESISELQENSDVGDLLTAEELGFDNPDAILQSELNGEVVEFTLDTQSNSFIIEGYNKDEMAEIIENLILRPPFNHDEDFDLQISTVSTEDDGSSTTTDPAPLHVSLDSVADAPFLLVSAGGDDSTFMRTDTVLAGDDNVVEAGASFEDETISLSIDPTLFDPSETLSITISGIPEGAVLWVNLDGLDPFPLPIDDGTVVINNEILFGNLSITPPENSNEFFQISVTATSTEPENNDTASTTAYINIDPIGVADEPVFEAHDVAGDEDVSIALEITSELTDTDGSEIMSIEISGFPDGAELSYTDEGGVTQSIVIDGAGSVVLTPEQMNELSVTPPTNSDVDFDLHISVTVTEDDGNTLTRTDDITVVVNAVADTPNLNVADVVGYEDTNVALDLSASLNDTDGSETLSIQVSGLPDGASLTAGILNNDGSYTLTPDQLSGLMVVPVSDSNEDFTLTVTATSVEDANGDSASTTQSVLVDMRGVADTPTLDASLGGAIAHQDGTAFTADEDMVYELNLDAALTDADLEAGREQSETLSITVSDVPDGVTLSAGTLNNDGSYTLSPDEFSGLTMTVANTVPDDFVLTVTSKAQENDGDVAERTTSIHVEVAADPSLEVHASEGFEDEPIPLNIDAALTDVDGETLSITISDIPDGAVITSGSVTYEITDGSLLISEAMISSGVLDDLHIIAPENSSTDFVLNVMATSTTASGDIAEVDVPLSVQVFGVADDAIIDIVDVDITAEKDTAIDLNISSSASDTDGSETISIVIENVPDGATLSAGTLNDDGSYSLTAEQLAGLTVTPAPESEEPFTLVVRSTSVDVEQNGEAGESDTTTVTEYVNITINETADAPIVSISNAQGNEDTAIALNINAVEADAGEVLSITVTDIPTGATLSVGTVNQDGSVTLTPEQLSGLTITPAANSNDDFVLKIAVTSSEGGTSVTVNETLAVDVVGVADDANLSVNDAAGDSNTAIALDVTSSLNDLDGSETLSLSISNIPNGAVLMSGAVVIAIVNGVADIAPNQLAGLSITPPAGSSEDMALQVVATSSEDDGDATSVSGVINVVVTDDTGPGDVADPPTLVLTNAVGDEDTAIALDITASLTDPSETLSITISGIPVGATLSAGTVNLDGTVTLLPTELSGLTITPPEDSNLDFYLTVEATSQDGTDTSTTSGTVFVDVVGVADDPELAVILGDGDDTISANSIVYDLEIQAALADNDGSETLSVRISGVPVGATLSAGIFISAGVYEIDAADFSSVQITVNDQLTEPFDLSIEATATENDGDAATHIAVISVDPILAEDQIIDGTNQDDILVGGAGDDTISGGNSSDELYGEAGDDHLMGENSSDTLYGGDGDDVLDGGNASDILVGGAGDDTLTGGEGTDSFVFDAESGHDIITDIFAQDTLVFEGQEFDMDDLILSENQEGDVVVSFQGIEGASVTLDGVKRDDLDPNHDGDISDGYSVSDDGDKVTITIDSLG